YLPYATSLRMSDLGYTNSEQSSLNICYNSLSSYVSSVRDAINTPSEQYAAFSSNEKDGWEQLNSNVLQIENELYSPIRPKQVAKSLEKPSDALENRGVSYIEVRALDVNPFSPLGIDENQFYFLDVFLLYCLLKESPDLAQPAYEESDQNLDTVVIEGRKPGLMLTQEGKPISLLTWATELFVVLKEVAKTLDNANMNGKYSSAVEIEFDKIKDPSNTPSAKWLKTLTDNDIDNSKLGLKLADEYKKHASGLHYLNMTEDMFRQQAEESIESRVKIEEADTKTFAEFIRDYFAS
ncbi:MAG: glutamate--cysteine ligase, partial [Glaciecola sp.]